MFKFFTWTAFDLENKFEMNFKCGVHSKAYVLLENVKNVA